MSNSNKSKHWLRLYLRILRLYIRQNEKTSNLISKSYNKIAENYDETWTGHMRHLSADLVDRLSPKKASKALDLTCGTGFVTGKLAEYTKISVTGVDASKGMLEVARKNHKKCKFIHSDILKFLKDQPSNSYDIVTCAWGLGYTRPFKVIREISRILKPGGKVGIIDNSHYSISEMVDIAFPLLAENPKSMSHIMKIHFLKTKKALTLRMKLSFLSILDAWEGSKDYYAKTGKEAINRMTTTGAAAGFEFSFSEKARDEMFKRYAEAIEDKYGSKIPIIHRYFAAIGKKK